MVAHHRRDGELYPWSGAPASSTMVSAWADRAISTKGTTCRCRPMTSSPQPSRRPSSLERSSWGTTDLTRHAQPSDTIVLVHATAPASSWLGAPYYERAVGQIHDAAERVLDEMRPIAEQVETPIEFEVLEGPPAEVLIRVAAARDADEIVVGSRGLGRLRGALGSVSQELLREAARPVLVVSRDAATALTVPALAS